MRAPAGRFPRALPPSSRQLVMGAKPRDGTQGAAPYHAQRVVTRWAAADCRARRAGRPRAPCSVGSGRRCQAWAGAHCASCFCLGARAQSVPGRVLVYLAPSLFLPTEASHLSLSQPCSDLNPLLEKRTAGTGRSSSGSRRGTFLLIKNPQRGTPVRTYSPRLKHGLKVSIRAHDN